jgi:phage gp45-like
VEPKFRRALIDLLRNYLAGLIRRTLLATPSADGFVEVEGWGSEAGEPEGSYTARIIQHYGFWSHVPEGAETVVVAVAGGSANGAVVATELPGTKPEIEKGEVAIFSKFGQKILLDKDGNVIITPKSGAKVLLGDSTGTDPVVLKSELNSVLSTVRTWLNGHIHPTPSGTSSVATTPIGTLSVSGSPNTEAKS